MTTVVTIIVGTLFAIILFYTVRIIRNISGLSDIAKREGKLLSEDIDAARSSMRKEGFKLRYVVAILQRFTNRKRNSRKKYGTETD